VRSDCKAAGSFLAPNGAVAETRAPYKTKPEKFEGSSRYYRGRVVAHLRGLLEGESCSIEVLGSVVKPDYIANDEPWLLTLLQGLQRDGLVTMSGEGTATVVSLPL
jgi:A/G-specific adenine glycosylase